MLKRVMLILTLLVTSAAADDYRSYRQAYAGVNWPSSVTSTEQCQQRVADVVARFGFTDAEFKTDRGTFICSLEYQRAPMTVSNFVGDAEA